jgi:HPt (histidine-containing phosphotransfer) domain-containing protein
MSPALPIDRIPSPPLAPGDDPIDLDHLHRMTLGDAELRHEALVMFLRQTAQLLLMLGARPGDRAVLAHTLKGSARAIGAFAVAKAAEALEAAIRNGIDQAPALAEVEATVAPARALIEAILEQP